MKIMLICAGGASTSILMKKMRKYADEKGINLDIIARSIGNYDECSSEYDIMLLGPQVAYQKERIETATQKPVTVIAPYDYAIGNVENIFHQVNEMLL